MIDQIKQKHNQISKDNNITIFYACESGSRAWGFPSPESDWDVRFIYIRNIDWYLSIKNKKNFFDFLITKKLDKGLNISELLITSHEIPYI